MRTSFTSPLTRAERVREQNTPEKIRKKPASRRTRDTKFTWSGALSEFTESVVPYTLSRGQVIPFSQNGGRYYYAGVDATFNEVGGFGGTISRCKKREGAVACAFREFAEETMRVFEGAYDRDSAEAFVVDDTLVILLPVRDDDYAVQFQNIAAQTALMKSKTFRENNEIVSSSSSEMRDSLRTGRLGDKPLWTKYHSLLTGLVEKYGYSF